MKAKISEKIIKRNREYCNRWSLTYLILGSISCLFILTNIVTRVTLYAIDALDNKLIQIIVFAIGLVGLLIAFVTYLMMITFITQIRTKNIEGKHSIKAYSITVLVLWCVGLLLDILGAFYILSYTYPYVAINPFWINIIFQVLLCFDALVILALVLYNFLTYYKK